jgi:hypothetical protein
MKPGKERSGDEWAEKYLAPRKSIKDHLIDALRATPMGMAGEAMSEKMNLGGTSAEENQLIVSPPPPSTEAEALSRGRLRRKEYLK